MLGLNFKQYGHGDTNLIILHGFLGSLDNWHSLASAWGDSGLTVYTLDQRNHGRSPHTANHTLELMVEDLKDFIHSMSLQNTVVLGHSMGGKVAMQFALNHPDYLKALIVADMAPRAYKNGAHDDVFRAILNVDLSRIQTRKEAEEAMIPFLGDFGTRQFVLKSLDRTEDGFKWKFNIDTLYRDYQEVIMAVDSDQPANLPALFLRGEQSLYVKPGDEADIHRLFPAATIQTIPQAGHWLHADQPAAFQQAVLQFIHSNT